MRANVPIPDKCQADIIFPDGSVEKNARSFWRAGVYKIRRRLIFPGRCHPSIVSTGKLNFCVRNGNRCGLPVITTGKLAVQAPRGAFLYVQNYIMRLREEGKGIIYKNLCHKSIWSSPRPISTGPLNALLRLHSRPIYHVFCMGPYSLVGWDISS